MCLSDILPKIAILISCHTHNLIGYVVLANCPHLGALLCSCIVNVRLFFVMFD